MTQALEKLSAAATQGECRVDPGANSHCFDGQLKIGDTCIGFVEGDMTIDDDRDYHIEPSPDAAFIVALVNAYRTGQLVEVQADDATVERVKNAIGTSLAYDIGMDVRAGSLTDDEKRKVARKAIAAMKGPKP